jgi:hypothetical protein
MTRLTLLNRNNKTASGGGNVKQGMVPKATAFMGMRLKTNLNRARNSLVSGTPYDGVCLQNFNRTLHCISGSE